MDIILYVLYICFANHLSILFVTFVLFDVNVVRLLMFGVALFRIVSIWVQMTTELAIVNRTRIDATCICFDISLASHFESELFLSVLHVLVLRRE